MCVRGFTAEEQYAGFLYDLDSCLDFMNNGIHIVGS